MRIITQTAEQWREARELRLEMLADSPKAFLELLSNAQGADDDVWRTRQASACLPDSFGVAAVDDDGRWRGQMRARIIGHPPPARVFLLSVYLDPELRGRGVAEQLLARIIDWTQAQGFASLTLEVHEHMAAAIRFYEKVGFVDTGRRVDYMLAAGEFERVMELQL